MIPVTITSLISESLKLLKELFPSAFESFGAEDWNKLNLAAVFVATRCFSLVIGTGNREEVVSGIRRNWNTVEFMFLEKAALEQKNNTQRVFVAIRKLAGLSVGIIALLAAAHKKENVNEA